MHEDYLKHAELSSLEISAQFNKFYTFVFLRQGPLSLAILEVPWKGNSASFEFEMKAEWKRSDLEFLLISRSCRPKLFNVAFGGSFLLLLCLFPLPCWCWIIYSLTRHHRRKVTAHKLRPGRGNEESGKDFGLKLCSRISFCCAFPPFNVLFAFRYKSGRANRVCANFQDEAVHRNALGT